MSNGVGDCGGEVVVDEESCDWCCRQEIVQDQRSKRFPGVSG